MTNAKVPLTEPSSPPTGAVQAGRAIKWTSAAVIGRQLFQIISAVVLARILGPTEYGVIGVATIYTTLTLLLLDQGLSAALIQRPQLSAKAPGVVASLNIGVALGLGALTWFLAPLIAGFFGSTHADEVLRALAIALVLKGLAVAPRAMLSRRMDFRPIALADLLGGLLGAIAGISAAAGGAGSFAIVYQTVTADILVFVVLVFANRGPAPRFSWAELRPLLPFSLRVFGTNAIAYLSRNVDNVLVGRFLGLAALAYYAMAYRILVVPVQFIGQTVNRVMFPLFSRIAADRAAVSRNLVIATALLAACALPPMALAAIAAPELVSLVLGPKWAPAVPLITVLAIAGARETVFYITPALMKALGLASLNLRFEILSTSVQVAGIVIGLQFGLLGVALGYLIAGVALTPVILLLQRRITGTPVRAQLGSLLPAVHVSVWGVVAYAAVSLAPLPVWATLVLGTVAFAVALSGAAAIAHRRWAREVLSRGRSLLFARKAVAA